MEQVTEQPRMDERGLVELDDAVPKTSKIEDGRAVLDARDLTTRKINAELRWLIYERGVGDVTVLNPSARHSLGVAILARCRIRFEGSLGYFGCGLIDGSGYGVLGRRLLAGAFLCTRSRCLLAWLLGVRLGRWTSFRCGA